jgi:hypothetical protein
MLGGSSVVAQPVASQVVLISIELVSYLVTGSWRKLGNGCMNVYFSQDTVTMINSRREKCTPSFGWKKA